MSTHAHTVMVTALISPAVIAQLSLLYLGSNTDTDEGEEGKYMQ